MVAMATAQLAIRFILELAALVAAGIVGASIGNPPLGLVGGLAGAVLFGVVWGLFLAPRARFPQPPTVRLVAGTAVMEAAAVGYALVGPPTSGLLLAATILANAVWIAAIGDTDADAGAMFNR